MGNLKKKRRLKMNKHKRSKRSKSNRHKKRTWAC
ncbi:MAG: AURKAIP1/COX24 domain-containing protein [Opitutales bacterium]|nr:AURKAIP1/COX24 domain-containing protein [Opitutales bacterium]MBO7520703.1 AURKAIP1/COX24 domain-containing protein [Opitutales bacterium]MBR4597307.1 AURKAIP1/COX24 domain-containing protein [Opitutales bacterium]MBR6388624.1 AURKAIP1/COX24 domain-containing protein [Opitutales bacterium]